MKTLDLSNLQSQVDIDAETRSAFKSFVRQFVSLLGNAYAHRGCELQRDGVYIGGDYTLKYWPSHEWRLIQDPLNKIPELDQSLSDHQALMYLAMKFQEQSLMGIVMENLQADTSILRGALESALRDIPEFATAEA